MKANTADGARRSGHGIDPRSPRRRPAGRLRSPLWAKLCVIFGSLIVVASGAAIVVPRALANWATGEIQQKAIIPTELKATSIDGPINVLLLGLDGRQGQSELGRADSILMVHVPASHDQAYLISIPRDSQVTIPPFPATNFPGRVDKVNASFFWGARTANGKPDMSAHGREQGAALTALTINKLVPGGLKFNGMVIVNFDGFKRILEALNGVDLCVDEETRSIHFDKNDRYHSQEVPYRQRKVYPTGCYHMKAWEALDFSRQRHFDDGADYVRQRHQQQLLMAIFRKLMSKGTITDAGKVTSLQKAAGDLLTLDLGGGQIIDWLWTLKGIGPSEVVMIKTNGGQLNPVGNGNEALTDESMDLLKAVHDGTVLDFVAAHPEWVIKEK